jgi:hypothetical protein
VERASASGVATGPARPQRRGKEVPERRPRGAARGGTGGGRRPRRAARTGGRGRGAPSANTDTDAGSAESARVSDSQGEPIHTSGPAGRKLEKVEMSPGGHACDQDRRPALSATQEGAGPNRPRRDGGPDRAADRVRERTDAARPGDTGCRERGSAPRCRLNNVRGHGRCFHLSGRTNPRELSAHSRRPPDKSGMTA